VPDISVELYDRLVEQVYAAGLDGSRWPRVVDAIAGVFDDGLKVSLQVQDFGSQESLGFIQKNHDPCWVNLYENHYAAMNVWFPKISRYPTGKVVTSSDVVPYTDLLRTEFWADFLRPQKDMDEGAGIVCVREETRMLALTANYAFKARERYASKVSRLLKLLYPHLSRSFQLQGVIEGHALANTGYLKLLETIDAAVLLLDDHLRICHANENAERLLSSRDLFYTARDLSLRSHGRHLRSLLARARIAAEGPALGGNCEAMHLSVGLEGARLLVEVYPFFPDPDATRLYQDFPISRRPRLLLVVRPQGSGGEEAPQRLAVQYGLTAAEARVAEALYEGMSVSEFALAAELSISTVRNQVRGVFAKTGTRRQAELVALVSKL